MPRHIAGPTQIEAAGHPPKRIEEFFGRVNSHTEAVSVARMVSPPGWEEPAQTPEFDEYTLVLGGLLRVEHDGGVVEVRAGEAIVTARGERVALFDSRRGCRVHRGLPPGVLTGHGPPRLSGRFPPPDQTSETPRSPIAPRPSGT